MNIKLILVVLVAGGLSSCSTAYKIEQTPDDVYYSPAPPQNDYVQVKKEEDRTVYTNSSPDDREIMRRVNNRRWRRNNPYDYGYGYPYDYGYYPYGNNYPVYSNPKSGSSSPTFIGPRKYNLGTYTTPAVTYTLDPKSGKIMNAPASSSTRANGTPARSFNKPNNGTGVGNIIRKVFSGSGSGAGDNNDNTSQSRSSRSFEPSSRSNTTTNTNSSSSGSTRSSGSTSGGNAPVRSFKR
ncbi:MAG: hypothetical protein ABIO55_07095 [Ginsengibacter sp.]